MTTCKNLFDRMVFKRRRGYYRRYTSYSRSNKTRSNTNYSEYRTIVNNLEVTAPLKYMVKAPNTLPYARAWRLKWIAITCTVSSVSSGLPSQLVLEIGDQRSKSFMVVPGTVTRCFLRNDFRKEFTTDMDFIHAEINNIGAVPISCIVELCWMMSNDQMNALKVDVDPNSFVDVNMHK